MKAQLNTLLMKIEMRGSFAIFRPEIEVAVSIEGKTLQGALDEACEVIEKIVTVGVQQCEQGHLMAINHQGRCLCGEILHPLRLRETR